MILQEQSKNTPKYMLTVNLNIKSEGKVKWCAYAREVREPPAPVVPPGHTAAAAAEARWPQTLSKTQHLLPKR